ncbi:MAG: hypothetical protein JJE09_11425 [Bacteroidia bacterium]|nr:hypothetical protein [Bacteroidia bacterium]
MGFLETAIVVYLRALYYPNGFMFPLSIMDPQIGVIEIVREAATIIMLSTVGILAGRSTNQRFAFFLATFAIWDIFYYVFLKVFLGWPESFLTWDILFLIPVPWIGPVLAPCMISTTMLILAVVLVYRDAQNTSYRLSLLEWIFLFVGSFVVVASWTMDFLSYNVDSATTNSNTSAIATYIPLSYNWYLFCIGEVLLLIATYLFWKRTSKTRISS